MKVDKITFGATIPTTQYGNIQPEIVISDVETLEEAEAIGMGYIKDLYARFSSSGALPEKESSLTPEKKNLLMKKALQ